MYSAWSQHLTPCATHLRCCYYVRTSPESGRVFWGGCLWLADTTQHSGLIGESTDSASLNVVINPYRYHGRGGFILTLLPVTRRSTEPILGSVYNPDPHIPFQIYRCWTAPLRAFVLAGLSVVCCLTIVKCHVHISFSQSLHSCRQVIGLKSSEGIGLRNLAKS